MIIQSQTQSTNSPEFVDTQLLAAGSKISAMDLYRQQLDIPIVRGKYYPVDDVQNVFILTNGVLDDVSQHASRTAKQLDELRQETSSLKNELTEVKEVNQVLTDENVQLQNQVTTLLSTSNDDEIAELRESLRTSEENYSNLLQSASDKLKDAQNIENENQLLKKKNEDLNARISELEDDLKNKQTSFADSQTILDLQELLDIANATIETQRQQLNEQSQIIQNQGNSINGLTDENKVLQYKVDTMRTLNKLHQ